MKLRVGDEIIVTAGKDKGKKGKIDKVFLKGCRVRIMGVNVYKRHKKGMGGEKGGIIEFARPIRVSNVALVCPNCSKATRVGYLVDKRGEKSRICLKCKRVIRFEEKGGKK